MLASPPKPPTTPPPPTRAPARSSPHARSPHRQRPQRAIAATLATAAALATAACDGAAEPAAPAPLPPAPQPAAPADLAQLPLTPGFAEAIVTVPGQGPRDITVWIPEGPGPHPLALFLHGGGGGDRLIEGLLGCLVQPALAPLGPIILAPRNTDGQWWLPREAAFALGLVQAAQATWSIDPRRTLLLGYSNGAIATWFFARERPDLFAAAIPMASSASFIGPTPLPIYAISGEHDELFPFDTIRRAIDPLIADGHDITLHTKPDGTHFQACDYIPELQAASEWLTREVWGEGE